MMASPTSDMAGHPRLHDRVMTALNRCLESQDVDFKESAPWPDLRYRIVKTAMAMGNLRDGGIIVVGASERNATWGLTGISELRWGRRLRAGLDGVYVWGAIL
jgi:hypothetical protein